VSPQAEPYPSDVESTNDTHGSETEPEAGDTSEQDTSLESTTASLRDLLITGGLFCTYVIALTAVGIYRTIQTVFRYFRNLY
jgi:hypothetical protein